MIRKFFRKLASKKDKFDHMLDKHNLPREYFNINRKMIANGLLVGLFWAFIPMPMQMLAVLATTPFIRFNILIAFAMVWLSNPLTMPFMYYLEYITGNFILGYEGVNNIKLTLDWFTEYFDDIMVPLYAGAIFYSITVSSFIYYLSTHLWIKSVHKEKRIKTNKRKVTNIIKDK